jgi:hypothetical protein
MKNILPILLGGALLPLAAQATSTSNVVGYETIDLPAGQEYILMGLRLHSPTVVSSTITGLAGNVVSDSSVDFDSTLTAGTTYIFEVNSGVLQGAIGEVTGWGTASGNTVNDVVVAQDLGVLGVVVGDSYTIRAAPTLEELFDATVLTPGFVAGQADLVWIPDGAGNYNQYYMSSLAGNPWKDAATNAAAPNVPVIYTDGILIQKRAASPTTQVVISGEVKTADTLSVVLAGTTSAPSFNLLSTVYPAGSTLQNIGIKDNLLKGFVAGQADLVWVPNGSGGYAQYYVSSLAGNPWKDAATNAEVTVDVPLPSGILVQRKAAATNLNLTPPLSYASL